VSHYSSICYHKLAFFLKFHPNHHILAVLIQSKITSACLKGYIKICLLLHPWEIQIILAVGIFFNMQLWPFISHNYIGQHLWEDQMNIKLLSVKKAGQTYFFEGKEITSLAYLWKSTKITLSRLARGSWLLPRFVYALLVVLRPSLHLYIPNRPLRL
jgi:hypothetical protein